MTDIADHSKTRRQGGAAPRRGGGARAGRAFSLIELMVAIVILGLGLVMVATMFPVAWGRARELSEFTIQQSITPAAENLASRLLHVAGSDLEVDNIRASFAGDLIYDPVSILPVINPFDPPPWPSDTLVHALNVENIRIHSSMQGRAFVAEDPWRLERGFDLRDPSLNYDLFGDLVLNSYMNPQVFVHQRFHPPLRARDPQVTQRIPRASYDDPSGVFTGDDDKWDDAVSSRRFAWAMFHRLHERVAGTAERADEARSFDFYYVTLRRPKPTNRYARQNPENGMLPPSARDDWFFPLAIPEAMQANEDVAFPIAWRVQVEFPESVMPAWTMSSGLPEDTATNIPTEIRIPPEDFTGSNDAKRMLVTMFPRKTRFIDEYSGKILRVVQAREAVDGLSAILTLDREVSREELDIDLTPLPGTDPVCIDYALIYNLPPGSSCSIDYLPCREFDGCANPPEPGYPIPPLDPPDRIRTVWVFPPPTVDRKNDNEYPVFSGSPPVVQIDVRSITIYPNG